MNPLRRLGNHLANRNAAQIAQDAHEAATLAQSDAGKAAQFANRAQQQANLAKDFAELVRARGETALPEGVDDLFLYYTQRAGELCRQLSLGAIGAIWLVKPVLKPGEDLKPLPFWLGLSLMAIVACLFTDALQYIVGLWVWHGVVGNDRQHFKHHPARLRMMLVFLTTKVALALFGYACLAWYAGPVLLHH